LATIATPRLAEDDSTSDDLDVERERLAALDRYDVLDTSQEEAFDRIARLAMRLFQVPIATIALVDGHRQWFKSCVGMDARETPRSDAFCDHTIRQNQPLIVPDAAADPRFADNPYVTGVPHVRFYAGIPLHTSDGHNIGTLCAIDTKPRNLGPEGIAILTDLAQVVMDELELRRQSSADLLTGALSRSAFKQEGKRAVALAQRHHHDLSYLALDLDSFRSINHEHGHRAGERALAEVAGVCTRELRQSDLFGRLGGQEFGALLPYTGAGTASDVAEKLRAAIARAPLDAGGMQIKLTASLGVASLGRGITDFDALLKAAETALRQAKEEGRNRVVAWAAPAEADAPQRRRVLKGGRILFNERKSSIDCTVRSLSDEGAGMDVYSTVHVPKLFELSIPSDGILRQCRAVSRTDKHIEAAFI
jgi:diguanylate cyclase (GGDEF)-like protein